MGLLDRWRRRRDFPVAWEGILRDNVPLCRHLPPHLQERHANHILAFLDAKQFEGCGGLEITDEMRVTVAGHACLLLLGSARGSFPGLGTVVIYPESFATPLRTADSSGIVTETVEERFGESWEEGTVILAWDSITAFLRGRSNDCNVIVHEFAHQLDAAYGITAGAPLKTMGGQCRDWTELLAGEPRRQRHARRRGRPEILDPYAFTSEQELFAVASETFFMRPVRFKSNHPQLYAELQSIYGVDPAEWMTTPR